MNLEIRSASRDGGNDADLVVLGHRSGQVVEVANVLVVKVDIDKAAQFLAVEEPLAEGGKCGSQVGEDLATVAPAVSTLSWPPAWGRRGVGIRTVAMVSFSIESGLGP